MSAILIDVPVLVEILAEVERLRALNESLVNARAAAAEVLGRVANKLPVTCCECREVLRQMEEAAP